jgi:sulfite reductase (ferredoxin)
VSEGDLPALYEELKSVGLHAAGAGTIVDITACPGTDTCKLGIASSRGLAAVLREQLAGRAVTMDQAIQDLHIKISGCFNSCGQHHVADLGFYGVSRNKNNYTVPHFQVLLGGRWEENAGSYGLAIGAVPAKRIPEAVDRITGRYLAERQGDESFQQFTQRIGKAECKKMLEDLTAVPPHDEEPALYTDWGDAREFTIGDMGVGECAGEVVSPVDFALTACERQVFEAQLLMERGEFDQAVHHAYESMLHGASALLRHQRVLFLENKPDTIINEFRAHLYDTQLFFDPFAQGKFGQYLFRAHEMIGINGRGHDEESAHRLIEEAQLFIEACHSCYGRIMSQAAAPARR